MRTSRLILIAVMALAVAGGTFVALNAPSVSAQGGTTGPGLIVFSSNRSGNYEIYVLDPNTGLATQLTNSPSNDIDPVWSSDGKRIAFASDRDGSYKIYVMNADGTNLKVMTNNQAQNVQPRWQPGDQWIVFNSNVNGQWDVYAVSVDGGIVRQLTNDPADERGALVAGGAGVLPPGGTGNTTGPGPLVVTATLQATPIPDAVVTSATLNVRANPGTGAQILETIPRGSALKILGRYVDNTWLQVMTPTGTIGWVSADLLTININLLNVQIINATFMAPPPTSTPVPPTPSTGANLVGGIVAFTPSQPTCQQTFTVGFDVANLGTQPTSVSGTVSLVDSRAADGSVQGTTVGGFPILQPGQTFRVNMPLTISTYYNEQHNITVVIDPANQIPETTKADNVRVVSYTLSKGSCP